MEIDKKDRLAQLERILHSRALHGSESLRSFLQFVVLKTIDDHEDQLKEYTIATEVFGRGDTYNPKIDSVVRVQAGRLRSKLQEYYATEGKLDTIVIDLPKGHYKPVFLSTEIAPPAEFVTSHSPSPNGAENVSSYVAWPASKRVDRAWLIGLSTAVILLIVTTTMLAFSNLRFRRNAGESASSNGSALYG